MIAIFMWGNHVEKMAALSCTMHAPNQPVRMYVRTNAHTHKRPKAAAAAAAAAEFFFVFRIRMELKEGAYYIHIALG